MKKHLLSIFAASALAFCAPAVHAQTANGKVTTGAPTYSNNTAMPLSLDTNGNLRVNAGAIQADTNCTATAIPPTYIEGTPNPISCDLTGQTRISGTINAASSATATAAPPIYIEGVSEPISQDLAGNQRTRLMTSIPAGTNNIGDVDVLTLPSIPAGANNIGDVDVLTLPAIPAGNNNIGDVDAIQSGTWNVGLNAGSNNIGDVDVLTLPAIPAGNNNIGDVDVASLPALPSGSNTIGTVNVARIQATPVFDNSLSSTPEVLTATPGYLYSTALGCNANACNIWFYNASSTGGITCAAGSPVAVYSAPSNTMVGESIALGKYFSTGIVYCSSAGTSPFVNMTYAN